MFQDFINLLFPESCVICNRNLPKSLHTICLHCNDDLPLNPTFFEDDNYTSKIFRARLPIVNAVSLMLFQKKGVSQKLLHELKYRQQEHIGQYFGDWFAQKLLKTNWHQDISMVVPVPIHPKKRRKRGYNQVTLFAQIIAKTLNIPFREDILIKTAQTKTQVFKSRIARWGKLDESFTVTRTQDLEGHHVLLIDDLVTTGATLEACGNKLLTVKSLKLSVATLAVTV